MYPTSNLKSLFGLLNAMASSYGANQNPYLSFGTEEYAFIALQLYVRGAPRPPAVRAPNRHPSECEV